MAEYPVEQFDGVSKSDAVKIVELEAEVARLQTALEEAEAQVAIMAAGYDHAADEVRFDKHQRGFEAALQLYQERIHQVRQKVRLSKAAKELLAKGVALEGAEARDRLRGKVLEDCATALHADRMHDGKWRDCLRWGCQAARAAIDIKPEEAREKE